MHAVWRIATEAPGDGVDEVSGTGAKISGGRWNSKGTPMVYCASNIALAALETLTTVRAGSLPFNRFLVRIDVPDAVWGLREELDPLPGGWEAVPSGRGSSRAGDAWIASGRSPLLLVPSVIVPEEQNVLINPAHAVAGNITAVAIKRWNYDPRFF